MLIAEVCRTDERFTTIQRNTRLVFNMEKSEPGFSQNLTPRAKCFNYFCV